MFQRCREVGINFFDTANTYSGGRAEEILGGLIAGCRDELVISSKFTGATGQDVNARGASRRQAMLAVEGSLKRLGTDRIDLYFVTSGTLKPDRDDTARARRSGPPGQDPAPGGEQLGRVADNQGPGYLCVC